MQTVGCIIVRPLAAPSVAVGTLHMCNVLVHFSHIEPSFGALPTSLVLTYGHWYDYSENAAY